MNLIINETNKQFKQQTTTFHDQDAEWQYEMMSPLDQTYHVTDRDDVSLNDFFARPIRIASYNWQVNGELFEDLDPWTKFFTNPRIINRLSNYNLLRCRLHLKFMINGNGFYYGRAIASYQPIPNADDLGKNRSQFKADIIQASQRPHVLIDPCTSQGGTMVLPFFYPNSYMDVPDEEWKNMGRLNLRSINALRHANASTDQLSISVFAWASDVQLSIPTSTEPGAITPQAGPMDEVSDEYGNGIISRPASVVASVAGMLKAAPVIGMYARATEMAASAVADVAAVFGMSRPNVITAPCPYQPKLLGNLVNSNVDDTAHKLTYDAKQELTVDTRTMGLNGDDEMSIKSIAMRESYLQTFSWQENSANDTLLWNARVNPVLWGQSGTGSNSGYHFPACATAAFPFKYWRGTIRFRFQVVASAFHKGRLKIVYDPSWFSVTNEFNTNYSRIVDISEERDFTVEIGWGQQYPYLQHNTPEDTRLSAIMNTSKLGADPKENANGIIAVQVLNKLSGISSGNQSPVSVNVFISAGDDFEVAGPTDEYLHNATFYATQAGRVGQGGNDEEVQGDQPYYPDDYCFLPDCPDEDPPEEEEPDKPDYSCLEPGEPIPGPGDPNPCEEDLPSFPGGDTVSKKISDQAGPIDVQDPTDALAVDPSDEINKPTQVETEEVMDIVNKLPVIDHTNEVFFGDPITSVRQILKRYHLSRTWNFPSSGKPNGLQLLYRWTFPNMPLLRGPSPLGIDIYTIGSGQSQRKLQYNCCNMTPLNWFMTAYTGFRGGIRWKYHHYGRESAANLDEMMQVSRISTQKNPKYGISYETLVVNTEGGKKNAQRRKIFPSGMAGIAATPIAQNPIVEAEIPFLIPYRFLPTRSGRRHTTGTPNYEFHELRGLENRDSQTGALDPSFDAYVSVGEDFTLAFFQGLPVVYFVSDPATLE